MSQLKLEMQPMKQQLLHSLVLGLDLLLVVSQFQTLILQPLQVRPRLFHLQPVINLRVAFPHQPLLVQKLKLAAKLLLLVQLVNRPSQVLLQQLLQLVVISLQARLAHLALLVQLLQLLLQHLNLNIKKEIQG